MGEARALDGDIRIIDSVTRLAPEDAGKVLIGGSHCGLFAAAEAAQAGLRAVILNDAGIGKDKAGIAGLAYLDAIGMAAAAVAHDSARIGDGQDMARRGVLSHVNQAAAARGCHMGQPCLVAARLLAGAPMPKGKPPPLREARERVRAEPGEPEVWALDSASLVQPSDVGQIVITGSHGGLLGGRPETALKVDCLAALYNDAGGGIDDAGLTRLPVLDRRGIIAATIAAQSARIGDGRSGWETGMLSHVNQAAVAAGGTVGMTVQEFIMRVITGGWRRERRS